MKGSIFAAAAIVGSALADGNMHRRHEGIHNRRAVAGSSSSAGIGSSSIVGSSIISPSSTPGLSDESCSCITKVITYYGEPTVVPIAPAPATSESTSTLTSTVHSTSTATRTVTVTPSIQPTPSAAPSPSTPSAPAGESPAESPASSPAVNLPTPGVTSFSKTGTYTLPATTLTVTDSTTVCGAATTDLPAGSHTIGQVTTVVETATTVTCPYATVKTSGTVTTSTIEMTTYTCPSAGTYTVVPGTPTSVPTSTMIVYPTPTPSPRPETTITATRTDYTYVCPYSDGLSSTSAPVVPTSAPVVPATTTAAAPATSSSESSKPSTTADLSGGHQMGMTFSPYTDSGDCMSKDEVSKNLKIIKNKGFNLVRVYSTNCNSLEYIGEACKELGLNMIIGIFIETTVDDARPQKKDIISWAQWDMVKLIVVGNEAISDGKTNAGELAGFIDECKKEFKNAGYNGQVTTTEPINIWQQSSGQLCGSVDIIGANIHPFFNSDTTAEKAGEFALAEWKELKNMCNGEKDVLNLETGWPSAGNANGKAIPGISQQKTAIEGIVKSIGHKSIFFSYANDSWKKAGVHDVEKYWGCADVF
ncbi:hypothetical protein N7492_001391 [Penicillium capsulatum]|uniref:Probable beta-glucosidase btgE n=1 Tax=Penicillium capsulatum TaxID=69766 RepID=A0A9W9LZU6_9EURO|nr:hypothetical protein N7492_001391 [Penicillium capsulatum]